MADNGGNHFYKQDTLLTNKVCKAELHPPYTYLKQRIRSTKKKQYQGRHANRLLLYVSKVLSK
ncbi:hypothetical protein C5167_041895 [Papaver somniferum]|nr:hypothetical protein C5167_041895 [Papaver somniferum]